MVFYGNSCMQGKGGQLYCCRAELSFLIALPCELSLENFLPLNWVLEDTCFQQRLSFFWFGCIPLGNVNKSWALSPPVHLSKDACVKLPTLLMSEVRLEVTTFLSLLSLISVCRLSAGRLDPHKETSCHKNTETFLGREAPVQQCQSCATVGEGVTGHWWLQKQAERLQQCRTVREGKGL